MTEVDVNKLRIFSKALEDASKSVSRLTESTGLAAAAAALPGTDIGALIRQSSSMTTTAVNGIDTRLATMSRLTREAADDYTVTEHGILGTLEAVREQARR